MYFAYFLFCFDVDNNNGMITQTKKTCLKFFTITAFAMMASMPLSGQYAVQRSETIGGNAHDFGNAIDISEEGFFAIGASSYSSDLWVPSNQGGTDFWIVQLTPSGDTVWSKTYGGFHNDDLFAIQHNADGGIAAFGTTRSDGGDVGNNPGVIGAWLMTTDINGNQLSSRVYAGELGEQGIDMQALSDGYALLVQSTSPELEGAINNGNFDYWVARVNNSGAVSWANFYGGTDADIPMRIRRISGGFIIAGSSNSTDGQVIGNKGGFDYWIVRLDIDGNIVWAKTYGGSDDDQANDIVPLDDGSFLVIGESESFDGDKTVSLGKSDLWIVKLDADGNILWEKTYGGSDTDIGLRGELLSNGLVTVTAITRSTDGHLNGNKGAEDAWVLFIDQDGDIEQAMNYGGTANDVLNAIAVTVDDVPWYVGTSPSRGNNLPASPPDGNNVWLFELNQDTVPCVENSTCFLNEISTATLNVGTNDPMLCTNSCNRGSAFGPSTIPGCHNFFGKPTTWFKIVTDSDAEQLSITVSSNDFNSPQVAVMQTLDCQNFLKLNCEVGENGLTHIVNIDVQPDTTYFIAVADVQGLTGDFMLCATVIDLNFCNNAPLLYATSTSQGSALTGPFLPGEDVQFCYEIPVWDKLDCNGLQGVQPSFGPGWDPDNFLVNGKPKQIDTLLTPIADGVWEWKNLGDVNYNFTNPSQGYEGGQGLPPGWYFTNQGDPPPNDNPNQTTGDITTCLNDDSAWKVCFTLTTKSACLTDLDCHVTVKSFADGEIGSIINQSCQYDGPKVFDAILKCCINPHVTPIPNFTICSGDTIIRALDSNVEPPVLYVWTVETFGNVVGAEDGTGPLLMQELFNFGSEPASATYTVIAKGLGCESPPETFTVVIRTTPSAQMSQVDDIVCAGKDVTLHFSFQGTPPFRGQYAIDDVLQDEFVSTEGEFDLVVALDEGGFFTFPVFRDGQCRGTTTGSFPIEVLDNSEKDTTSFICFGDTLKVGDDKYFVTGSYTSIIENATANGCDSIVNVQLFVRSKSGTNLDLIICEGDSVVVGSNVYNETGFYSDTLTNSKGCDSTVNLTLFVTTEILTEQSVILCPGESVDFRGEVLTESGIYSDTVAASQVCDSIFVMQVTSIPSMFLQQTVIVPDTGGQSGSINIQIGGGLQPYRYLWSTGDTTRSISDLEVGGYSVTVTDLADCVAEFNFFVTTATTDPIRGLNDLKLFPNPIASGAPVYLQFDNERTDLKLIVIRLIDITGKSIARWETNLVQGKNTIEIDTKGRHSEMLMIVIQDPASNTLSTLRLLIE
ncbi:MAG: hypothetical protein DRI69_05350 [Bacteroidetes bacterium]|nr:MAG: hypothetical protein DRI69_05350 [Bacteroidota bacterium]